MAVKDDPKDSKNSLSSRQIQLYNWLTSPPLPWHTLAWQRLTNAANTNKLAHGLLVSGIAGIGKRSFAYRFALWLLCKNKINSTDNQLSLPCYQCENCLQTLSFNQPNVCYLPQYDGKKKQLEDIKVDHVRELLPYVQQSHTGYRVVILDGAETMTVSAANALLKTLEEPAEHVVIILISDSPRQLLPTILSRVQRVDVAPQSTSPEVMTYINQHNDSEDINSNDTISQTTQQLLSLVGGAPLAAIELNQEHWYQQRTTWLKSWQAIRAGQRSPWSASDYWQQQLSLSNIITILQIMLQDLLRSQLGLSPIQQDIDLSILQPLPDRQALQGLNKMLGQIQQHDQQNIQTKLAIDQIFVAMAQL